MCKVFQSGLEKEACCSTSQHNIWQRLESFLVVTSGDGREARDAAKHTYRAQDNPPHQRTTQPKLSIVQRLRTLDMEEKNTQQNEKEAHCMGVHIW